MTRFLWLCLFVWALAAAPAQADELRPGYLEFTQSSQSDWRLVWKAPLRGGLSQETQPILPSGCAVKGPPEREAALMAIISRFTVTCSGEVSGKAIGLSAFGTAQTDVLVRVAPLGRPVQALKLTADQPTAFIETKPDRLQVAKTYLVLGIEHILSGYDHLLFVVSLVLLLTGWHTIVAAVTAFTVAHSLTLIGTSLGFLGLPQRPVEALIALSIIFLAVEIVKKQDGKPRLSERIPWVVAFLFGLLHGFGFAGALAEIGLPETDVPTALFTFNIGVEIGQLIIVVATIIAVTLVSRLRPSAVRPAIVTASYGIGAISSMWLIERLF